MSLDVCFPSVVAAWERKASRGVYEEEKKNFIAKRGPGPGAR